MPSLTSITDLNQAELHALVDAAVSWPARDSNATALLNGRMIGLYFAQPSTRTRTAFASSAHRLGAGTIVYGPNDLQLATGETEEDTGQVLSTMLDALVIRAEGGKERLLRLSADGKLPIVNAMNTVEHPTQAIGDLATMRVTRGELDGVNVLYVGEANSTTLALAHALMQTPSAHLTIAAPETYGLEPDTCDALAAKGAEVAATINQVSAMSDVPDSPQWQPDFVYTTQWKTTGTHKVDPHWRGAFYPEFQVDGTMMGRWPKARVMHDLPARRGDEITAEVLDGPRSLALEQAANKAAGAAASVIWSVLGMEGLLHFSGTNRG